MTLIGLISDVHATPEPVAEALSIFTKAGVDQVLCAGDIAGYMEGLSPTVKLLADSDCLCITGNHDLLYLDKVKDEGRQDSDEVTAFLKDLPTSYADIVDGKEIYMVHAEPPDITHGGIKLLDKEAQILPDSMALWKQRLAVFDYDVLIVGHTHQVFAERIGDMLVVNPGSTVFNHCCAILHLPEMRVELYPLSGKDIVKTWNWGEYMVGAKDRT